MAEAAQKRHSRSAFETQRLIEAGKRKCQKLQKMTIETVHLRHRESWRQVRGGGKSGTKRALR